MREYIDLKGDGSVVIFKDFNLKKPKWQVRLRNHSTRKYIFKSLKTLDLEEAKSKAFSLQYLGQPDGSSKQDQLTVAEIFELWTARNVRASNPAYRQNQKRVSETFLPFFKDRLITELKPATFYEYFDWRQTNFRKKPPSINTLKRERTAFLPLLRFAFERGYVNHKVVVPTIKGESKRRATFSHYEWQRLVENIPSWIEASNHSACYQKRRIAGTYFLLLGYSGIRVGEMRRLCWTNLRLLENDIYVGHVNGKTGTREVVFQPEATSLIKQLFDSREAERGHSPEEHEVLFCHKDGLAIHSFKKAFASLLTFLDFSKSVNGSARSIYSFRHHYATERLSNNVNPFLLAKNMGTSVEMLEKHYGHTVGSELADQITKRVPSPNR